MIANHIHDALAQVRTLQAFIIERNIFKGYSGKARIASGILAGAGTAVLASAHFPRTPWCHLAGWAAVAGAGLLFNYTALLYWFLFDPEVRRNPLMLKPALDALPALGIGAVLTVALVMRCQFDLLFGTWMCLYGLAQVTYRHSLPPGIYAVGLLYLACGTFCLLAPGISFLDPRPMGFVFFAGEMAAGAILIRDHSRSCNTERRQDDPEHR